MNREALRRFNHVKVSNPADVKELAADHPAVVEKRTMFPSTVKPGARLLVSGHNNRKIGKEVLKGPWKGMPIFTLTLQEICEMNDKHPLIAAMLAELPEPGFWPKEARQKWLTAFGSILDLIYPAQAATPAPPAAKTAEDRVLTVNQQHVLDALKRLCSDREDFTSVSMQGLAQESGVAMGSMPPIIERLQRLELIERRINPENKTSEYRIERSE